MSDSTHVADHKPSVDVAAGAGFNKGGAAAAHGASTHDNHDEHAKPATAAAPTPAPKAPTPPAKEQKNDGVIVLPFLPDFTVQQWIDTVQFIICCVMMAIGSLDYGKQPLWLIGIGPLICLLIAEDDPKWKLRIEACFIAGIAVAYAILNVDYGLFMTALVATYNGLDIVVWLLRRIADVLHWISKQKHGLSTIGK